MFKLNGKEMKLINRDPKVMQDYVEKIPFRSFISFKELLKKFGYADGIVRNRLYELLKDNIVVFNKKVIVGSKKTVKAFKKEIGNV